MSYEIVTMEDCGSCFGIFEIEGSRGDKYTVSFSGESGVHCTCKAFKFSRDQHCKHVDQVYKGACMYNPQYNDGKAEPEYKPTGYTYDAFTGNDCPACGGPLVAVRRAV